MPPFLLVIRTSNIILVNTCSFMAEVPVAYVVSYSVLAIINLANVSVIPYRHKEFAVNIAKPSFKD
jgi:hypothetical protein